MASYEQCETMTRIVNEMNSENLPAHVEWNSFVHDACILFDFYISYI